MTAAAFRFKVIAPLVAHPLGKGEQAHLLTDLSNRLWTTPDGTTERIHRRTITRWVARWRAHAFDGLMPEPRRDRGARRRLAGAIVDRAAALRREDPRRSVQTIIRILELEKVALPDEVKRSTLSHALCRMGVSRVELRRPTETFQRRESPYPGAMWQIDSQLAVHMPDSAGRRRAIYLVAVIDDFSRHVVAHYYLHDNRDSLANLLKRAIVVRGKPEILYSDNGANYRSNMLQVACAMLGIDLRHARPYRPQGKGKIERWFRTADSFNHEAQALVDHGTITALDDLDRIFASWLESEYNARVHSATHETPNARLALVDPQHPMITVDPATLHRAFLWTQSRTVSAAATISIESNTYQVDPGLSRRKITVRFDPYDLSRIHVEWQGQRYSDASPLKLVHHTSRELPAADTTPAAPVADRTRFLALVHEQAEAEKSAAIGRMRFVPPPSSPKGVEPS